MKRLMLAAMAVLVGFGSLAVLVVPADAGHTKYKDTLCNDHYMYSLVEPAWAKSGVPCWKPWSANPMANYKG